MNLIDLVEGVGLQPKWVATTDGGEYHSPCPVCGGEDRFIINPNKQKQGSSFVGSFWCRKCTNLGGDIVNFCQKFLGLSFTESVNYIGAEMPNNKAHNYRNSTIFQNKQKKNILTNIKKPSYDWNQQAEKVVQDANVCLLSRNDILEKLSKRGLPEQAIKQHKIGYIAKDKKVEGRLWGLEKETIWFPAGILIPTIDQDQKVIRLKIRRKDWQPNDEFPKYIAISGSMKGLNIIGNKKNSVMVVVESELDAYAVHHATCDFAFVIAVGSNIKNPDNVTDYLAKKKSTLLICYDNDDAGKLMLDKWKHFYPYAVGCSTPIGKDIGEAVQQGLDLRTWIVSKIPTQMQKDLNLIKHSWKQEDQALINWFLNETNLPLTPFVLTTKEHGNEAVRDPVSYYIVLRDAIAGGCDSWQARTGRLQEILSLLKMLI